MITPSQAQHFAVTWINTWNTRDLTRILSLYTDNFSMSSPKIVHFVGESSGKLRGKAAVAAYWSRALELRPDLHFELLEVFAGVDTICITYASLDGQRASEWLHLDDNLKIHAAAAHYAPLAPKTDS